MVKRLVRRALSVAGLQVKRIPRTPVRIPEAKYYLPVFSPWEGYGEFGETFAPLRGLTLLSPMAAYNLYALARHSLMLDGEFWECGVYKGGTAAILAETLRGHGTRGRFLRLFDTYVGMPATDPTCDLHAEGDFGDTSLDDVRRTVGADAFIEYRKGLIPSTFSGLESARVAFAHVDVDIYRSVIDCCAFIYPRLTSGAVLIFDDYGLPTTPGARRAVDEFFADKPESPWVQMTGQAVVLKV